MKKAAAAQDYEKAAELRDLLADLKRTTQEGRQFERVPYTCRWRIDPEQDLAELAKALDLPAPPQRIEGFDISNISGTFKVASLVSFRHGRPDRANYRRFKIKTVEGQDDFACMAEVVRRRYTRLLKESKGQSPTSAAPGDLPEGERRKSEIRNPKSERSPKAETRRLSGMNAGCWKSLNYRRRLRWHRPAMTRRPPQWATQLMRTTHHAPRQPLPPCLT